MINSSSRPIRVLLADDHPLLMAGFAAALGDFGMEIIGQAKTAEDAVVQFFSLTPDVIVLDIRFGSGMTGLEAAKQILKKDSQAKIVIFSQFDQPAMALQAYKMGVIAYLTKDSDPEMLAEAIRQAHAGDVFIPPLISHQFARMSIGDGKMPHSVLDERELQVFRLMAEGCTNTEIAEKLSLSPKTISIASQSVKDKLGVSRPADITRLAIKNGLLME